MLVHWSWATFQQSPIQHCIPIISHCIGGNYNKINSCLVRNTIRFNRFCNHDMPIPQKDKQVNSYWSSDDFLFYLFGGCYLKTNMTVSHYRGRKRAASSPKDLSCGTKITERLPGFCRRRRSNKDLRAHDVNFPMIQLWHLNFLSGKRLKNKRPRWSWVSYSFLFWSIIWQPFLGWSIVFANFWALEIPRDAGMTGISYFRIFCLRMP